jgi:hypothetical protein
MGYSDYSDLYDSNIAALTEYEDNLYGTNKKLNLDDARKEDSEIYLTQQNYLYILGTITLAIVFVGAIVVIKN